MTTAGCVLLASVAAGIAADRAGAQAPFPSGVVTLSGHGLGPGYGMGQWGAFGLATLGHLTYEQILAHYYSDIAYPVSDATLNAKADREIVRVAIDENDNRAVTVTSPSRFTYVNSAGKKLASIPAGHAARALEIKKKGSLTGLWELEKATSCTAAKWEEVATGLTDPIAVPASLAATAPSTDLLTLCRADDQDVTYRGRLEAYDYYGPSTADEHLERTLNLVALEQYVADVTPGESPAGWGAYGGSQGSPQGEPWGFQELEAQAVAARTYVLYSMATGGWHGYADICDDSCEWYAQGIMWESPLASLAVLDTAGQYLVQNGGPAPTEYGSSDGGYTEAFEYWNGQSIFDAVADPGDAVCLGGPQSLGCNPWHTWTDSIPVTKLERQFAVGTLESVQAVSTDASGRVTEIEIVGTEATVTASGATFAGDFGLAST
ncbi:MAG TPA: SpoIID/LytB domain-containing protein, partial [Acidimicrobiales bacterium]|nr:SpoIID/LytB domain-containing protein [Acidimicrobiales bacterium]